MGGLLAKSNAVIQSGAAVIQKGAAVIEEGAAVVQQGAVRMIATIQSGAFTSNIVIGDGFMFAVIVGILAGVFLLVNVLHFLEANFMAFLVMLLPIAFCIVLRSNKKLKCDLCEEALTGISYETHPASCRKRPVACNHCKDSFSLDDLDSHMAHCPQSPIISSSRVVVLGQKLNRAATTCQMEAVVSVMDDIRAKTNRGAVLHWSDKHGLTALHQACTLASPDVARVLLQNGANVDARDKLKQTPLHAAVMLGLKSVVELLVTSHADVNAKDSQNTTLIALARRHNRKSIERYLLENGAIANESCAPLTRAG